MAVDDAGDDIGEIAVRFDAEELTVFDQRSDDGPMLGAAIGPGEERVFAREGNRPNGSLDHVVVDFDPAVIEKETQACPTRQGITDRVGKLGLLTDQRQFLTQPRLQRLDQRTAALLPNNMALLGGAAADLALDPVEGGKALSR